MTTYERKIGYAKVRPVLEAANTNLMKIKPEIDYSIDEAIWVLMILHFNDCHDLYASVCLWLVQAWDSNTISSCFCWNTLGLWRSSVFKYYVEAQSSLIACLTV